ncbi:hypothetical protein IMZ38_05955 [Thermosphaera chiliense]|uniref:Uncharacterized protein n=1 Tax=Thermosphaera chiliense TaxID=3402707 RepID=A0A7M1UPP1_9CREN|nr:hypothetical protein [Thermosphaera aggregans]QOR94171.1 hypothetical protein IMZ38_05955 [Thermosphaera aggregans]
MRREIVKTIADVMFKELIFQSTTMFRLGGFLKDMSDASSSEFLRKVGLTFKLNKIFSTVVFAAIPWIYLIPFIENPGSHIIEGVVMSSSIVLVFLLAFLEVQNTIGIYMIRLPEIINLYPLSTREKLFSIMMLYFKLYDLPVFSFMLSVSILTIIFTGDITILIISVLVVALSTIYGLALAMLISKGFYYSLSKGGTKSRYLVSSAYSFLTVFLIVIPILLTNVFKTVFTILTSSDYLLYRLVFPSPFFNLLTSFSRWPGLLLIDVLSVLVYSVLAIASLRFILSELTGFINLRPDFTKASGELLPMPIEIKPMPQVKAFIKRYIRVVLRHPSYAIGFFMPPAIMIWNLIASPATLVQALQVGSMAMIAYPVLALSVEAHGHSLTVTLPVKTTVLTRSILVVGLIEYLAIYIALLGYAAAANVLTVSTILESWFTIPLVASLIMLEIWILFKLEGENLFTGTFYMKISKTIIAYLILSIAVVVPVWASYYYALLFMSEADKVLIPSIISLLILFVSARLFVKIR